MLMYKPPDRICVPQLLDWGESWERVDGEVEIDKCGCGHLWKPNGYNVKYEIQSGAVVYSWRIVRYICRWDLFTRQSFKQLALGINLFLLEKNLRYGSTLV
jgi:hypothetical protein